MPLSLFEGGLFSLGPRSSSVQLQLWVCHGQRVPTTCNFGPPSLGRRFLPASQRCEDIIDGKSSKTNFISHSCYICIQVPHVLLFGWNKIQDLSLDSANSPSLDYPVWLPDTGNSAVFYPFKKGILACGGDALAATAAKDLCYHYILGDSEATVHSTLPGGTRRYSSYGTVGGTIPWILGGSTDDCRCHGQCQHLSILWNIYDPVRDICIMDSPTSILKLK